VIVRAAIEGFAEGKIDLPAPDTSGNHGGHNGLSPKDFGFNCDDSAQLKFTREGLSDLLGMPHRRIVSALQAFEGVGGAVAETPYIVRSFISSTSVCPCSFRLHFRRPMRGRRRGTLGGCV
jgi:hypothetical protein